MDILKAVLVGCGSISKAWLDAARGIPDLEIVGLVDLEEENARKRAGEFELHDTIIGSDLKEVLAHAVPDIVFDCTSPDSHPSVTLEALKYGCHVLGEKPMAHSLDDAERMISAAQASNRIYAITQNRRYEPYIRGIKRLLNSGMLGTVTTITCDYFMAPHFGGYRDAMDHMLLLDMSIHTFDQARFLTNADPVAVTCSEWNPAGSWYASGASAIANFEMTNGIVFSYRGSTCAEGLRTSWNGDWRIITDQGSIFWDGDTQIKAQKVAGIGGFFSKVQDVDVPVSEPSAKLDSHAGVMREFLRSVRTGVAPETVCTDNIKSLSMVLNAIESAETGQSVRIKV